MIYYVALYEALAYTYDLYHDCDGDISDANSVQLFGSDGKIAFAEPTKKRMKTVADNSVKNSSEDTNKNKCVIATTS